jgi:hypothetical protein
MKSLMLVVCAAVAVLLPTRAAAQDPAHGDSPRVTITVEHPTQAGPVVLKPGDYRFQCRHIDGKTFLVITQSGKSDEIARIPCTEEALNGKAPYSEMRAVLAPDGTRTLQSVRIKGETIGHRVAD